MSEEATSSAPVEAAAPAAPAPAEASAPAEAVESAPVESAPEAQSQAPVAATEEEKELYDFSGWDGTVDSLPEEHRHAATGVSGYYESLMKGQEGETKRMQELYETLISGGEDPRLAELTTEKASVQAMLDAQKAEFESYQKEVEAYRDNHAKEEARRFLNRHQQLFESKENRETFRDFLSKGWDEDQAVKLLGLPAEALKVALDAKEQGVPDHYAIKMAHLETKSAPAPTPRQGARITSGATSSVRPSGAESSVSDARTLNEARKIAVAKAIKASRGGR